MFGKNPVMKQDFTIGDSLRVVNGSPFLTIQGEGPFSGQPAIFIRLHGCNLRCTFCDTEFSSPLDKDISVADLRDAVYEFIRPSKCAFDTLVVITGGEPVRQQLKLLIQELKGIGIKRIQIETAGTLWQPCLQDSAVTIVCSPKTAILHPKIAKYAHAFKYVISWSDASDKDGLPITNTQQRGRPGITRTSPLAKPRPGVPVYLSPMDENDPVKNKLNLKEVAERAIRHGYIAGIQLHKLIGLP